MLNPSDIQDAIVTLLRSIPELVAEIVDENAIQAYDDESQVHGEPEISAADMMGLAVLVVWAGAELPREGETRGWRHNFKVFLKADFIQAYYRLARLIIDGVPALPAGDGHCSFLDSVIHPDCDGIQNVELTPDQGRLSIAFSITER